MMESGRYHASVTTKDVWICYPWEAKYAILKTDVGITKLIDDRDIEEHDALAKENPIV